MRLKSGALLHHAIEIQRRDQNLPKVIGGYLKEVSDAISAGELNVRSEIQTGDEFEDLSHAFNRMLRNLVNMQDRLRKVNADLDRNVDELARGQPRAVRVESAQKRLSGDDEP